MGGPYRTAAEVNDLNRVLEEDVKVDRMTRWQSEDGTLQLEWKANGNTIQLGWRDPTGIARTNWLTLHGDAVRKFHDAIGLAIVETRLGA